MSVTFQKLATRIQKSYDNDPDAPQITQPQLVGIMHRVFYLIGDALSSGEDVYLEGFGRFYPDCKPPRKVKSGLTSSTHVTDYKVFVKFNPFKQLNNQVEIYLKRLGLDFNFNSDTQEEENDVTAFEERK
jgi:nucleoid DNA-binding protein